VSITINGGALDIISSRLKNDYKWLVNKIKNFKWKKESSENTTSKTCRCKKISLNSYNSNLLTVICTCVGSYNWNKGIEFLPQTAFIVWNIKGLRHWVAMILKLENQNLWQKLHFMCVFQIPHFRQFYPWNNFSPAWCSPPAEITRRLSFLRPCRTSTHDLERFQVLCFKLISTVHMSFHHQDKEQTEPMNDGRKLKQQLV